MIDFYNEKSVDFLFCILGKQTDNKFMTLQNKDRK